MAVNLPFLKKKGKQREKVEIEEGEVKAEDVVAPSFIEVKQSYLKLGERMCKSFFVFSYPRYLSTGWLSPVINLDSPLDVALHIHPTDAGNILKRLRKKVTEVQAEIAERESKGLVRDPSLEIAYQDIESLRDELQTARERIFKLGLYITVYGDTEQELREIETALRSILESRLIYLKPALMREKQGFISNCPYGMDQLLVHTPMNTGPLSSIFPFVSPDLSANEGILYGINQHNNSLVLFDRFTLENANLVVFAKSGAGKSTTAHTEVLVKDEIGGIRLRKMGQVVDEIIKKQGIDFTDEELEGKTFPEIKVWTFDENMKGKWGEVKIAARKLAPKEFYKFKTRSGREITTTGDHNLVALKNGKVELLRGDEVEKGEYIPLPRKVEFHSQEDKCKLTLDGIEVSSSEFLRLAGLITAEGTVMEDRVIISNTEEAVLDSIRNDLSSLNVKFSEMKDKYKNIRGIHTGVGNFTELVKEIGGMERSGEKKIWPFVFNLNKKQIAQYLSAYYEGDGGVEVGRSIVAATSKSKRLISEISYLLYSFGIISRIHKTKKEPTNCNWKEKKTYWKLSISGQDNLRKFAESINFITERKRKALNTIIQKTGNTNVDFIPDVAPIFKEIYDLFSCGLHNIQDISNIKRSHYKPSPEKVKEMVSIIEERIQQFKDRAINYQILSELPSLSEIIDLGKNNKELNRELWKTLGQSWRVVKNKGVAPGFINASKMIQVVSGKQYALGEVKQAIYSGFRETDLEVKQYSRSLQSALKHRPHSSTRYDMIQQSAQHVFQRYQEILNYNIPKAEEKLEQLKLLANSDLFWDPIVKVDKIENKKDKYVYDLTCENSVFLAGVGGMFVHNSYFTKLEILRYLMQDVDVIIIDPENEYQFLNDAVGGQYFKISLNSEHHLNPFDLPVPREDEKLEDVLRSNIINLVGLLRVMLGGLNPEEDGIIDQALTETYASKDITPETDPSTWKEKIPVMSDFEAVLSGMEGTESLLDRVRKFTKGSYAQFFNSPSNVDMTTSPFVVFGIRDMEESLRPMAMFIILRHIWSQIRSKLKRRVLLVDEAWWIMQSDDGASFLFGLCKRARKYWLGVTTITQDVSDFMKSDYGRPIITNSSLQFLMKQSPATIDGVQQTFNLTEGEKAMLLGSAVGEGIFIAGQKRVALKVVASYTEDQIITSSPEEVQKIKEAKRKLNPAMQNIETEISEELETREETKPEVKIEETLKDEETEPDQPSEQPPEESIEQIEQKEQESKNK